MEKPKISFWNRSGFTLVEIVIVVAIIGLLAAVAIPNLLRMRMIANENTMKNDLRTFSTGNENYRSAQNPPEYATDIATLTAAPFPYIDSSWNNNPRHGYNLTYSGGGVGALTYSLFAAALPMQAEHDFCVDQTGIVFSDGNGNATGCSGGTPIP